MSKDFDLAAYNKRYYDELESNFKKEVEELRTNEQKEAVLDTLEQYVDLVARIRSLPPLALQVYNKMSYHVYLFLRQMKQVQFRGHGLDESEKKYLFNLFSRHRG